MTEYYRIDFGSFELDIVISLDEITSSVSKRDLIKDQLRYSLKTYHYSVATKEYNARDIYDIYGIDTKLDSWDHVISTVWDYDRPIYKARNITKLPTCEGCRINAPGQDDHMQVGGCLYDPENPYY